MNRMMLVEEWLLLFIFFRSASLTLGREDALTREKWSGHAMINA